MMQAIADERRELRRLDELIAAKKSELRQLMELRSKRSARYELLLDEATGQGPPSLFSGIPVESHEVAPLVPRPATTPPVVAMPLAPPVQPEPEPEPEPESGWRATPLDRLGLDAEIVDSIQAMLRRELCFAGPILDQLIQGAKFGLDADQLPKLRQAIYALRGWRNLGLDSLELKPKVESKITRAGVETLGQLADRLDQGDTFHLGESDLRDVRRLVNDARADDGPEPEPIVCSPVGSMKLGDIEGFPAGTIDMLAAVGIRTLSDLQAKVDDNVECETVEESIYSTLRTIAAGCLTPGECDLIAKSVAKHLRVGDQSTTDKRGNPPGRGEPICDLGLSLADLEKIKTIAGSLSTDPKKVKGPQKVDTISVNGKPYVLVGTMHAPAYTQWELAPLFDEAEFQSRHPDQTLSDIPRTEQGPEFYTGTRVVVGRGKSSRVMVVGARNERRLLVHNK